jgi:hypothetical protein
MEGLDLLVAKILDDSVNVDRVIKEFRLIKAESFMSPDEFEKSSHNRKRRIKYHSKKKNGKSL